MHIAHPPRSFVWLLAATCTGAGKLGLADASSTRSLRRGVLLASGDEGAAGNVMQHRTGTVPPEDRFGMAMVCYVALGLCAFFKCIASVQGAPGSPVANAKLDTNSELFSAAAEHHQQVKSAARHKNGAKPREERRQTASRSQERMQSGVSELLRLEHVADRQGANDAELKPVEQAILLREDDDISRVIGQEGTGRRPEDVEAGQQQQDVHQEGIVDCIAELCQPNMTAVAGPLVWECIKGNSSFIRKSKRTGGCPVMSAEPGNLMALNSWKYSGLANRRALDVAFEKDDDKEKITLFQSHKKNSRTRRPERFFVKTGLSKQYNKRGKKGLATLDKVMKDGCYRKDLLDLAKKKYLKIKVSLRKRKYVVKSRRAKKASA